MSFTRSTFILRGVDVPLYLDQHETLCELLEEKRRDEANATSESERQAEAEFVDALEGILSMLEEREEY